MAHHQELNMPAAAGGPGFGLGDLAFLCLLVMALAGVVLAGRFAYREGMALETAKSNAQAFVKWAEAVAATSGKDAPMTLALCSMMPGETPEQAAAVAPEGATGLTVASEGAAAGAAAASDGAAMPEAPQVATTWATCREALFTAGGPLSELRNPFLETNPVAGNKCEKKNPATRGLVFIEKGTTPPPGMPASVSWSPLEDEEPMVRGLMLRVQACDAGGYSIKIGEVKL